MSTKPMYVWNGTSWVQVGDGVGVRQSIVDIGNTPPTGPLVGTVWYDNDGGGFYIFDGTYWVSIIGQQGPAGQQGIQGPQGIQGQAGTNGTNGTNGTDGRQNASYGTTAPNSPQTGDIWIDTGNGSVIKVYNGSTWTEVSSAGGGGDVFDTLLLMGV